MSRPKAILFGPLPPPYGGVAVLMTALKDACLSRGVEIWSYAGDGGDARVTKLNHRSLAHIWRVLRLPKGSRITDSTHFHLEYPHWLLLPLWLFAKRLRRFTWVKACHDGSLPFRLDEMPTGQKQRLGRAVAAVDTMVVSSPELVEFFRDKFGKEANYISPLMPLPTAFKVQRTPSTETTKTVISIGAFIPSYGFDQVADAIEQIRSDGTDVTLTLLDGAFARDEEYKEKTVAGRSWITVHESVPHGEVGRFLARSDVFARAFAHESYGLSRVEAIMSGTPVIATNTGETRGMLTYEFGDVDALTRHLESVFDGETGTALEHWQQIYRHEAEDNLHTYLQLITGGANA